MIWGYPLFWKHPHRNTWYPGKLVCGRVLKRCLSLMASLTCCRWKKCHNTWCVTLMQQQLARLGVCWGNCTWPIIVKYGSTVFICGDEATDSTETVIGSYLNTICASFCRRFAMSPSGAALWTTLPWWLSFWTGMRPTKQKCACCDWLRLATEMKWLSCLCWIQIRLQIKIDSEVWTFEKSQLLVAQQWLVQVLSSIEPSESIWCG